jgi:hypothetical protein
LCTDESCQYLHVHVDANAAICPAFVKGFCADGEKCKLRHEYEKKPAAKAPKREHGAVDSDTTAMAAAQEQKRRRTMRITPRWVSDGSELPLASE